MPEGTAKADLESLQNRYDEATKAVASSEASSDTLQVEYDRAIEITRTEHNIEPGQIDAKITELKEKLAKDIPALNEKLDAVEKTLGIQATE